VPAVSQWIHPSSPSHFKASTPLTCRSSEIPALRWLNPAAPQHWLDLFCLFSRRLSCGRSSHVHPDKPDKVHADLGYRRFRRWENPCKNHPDESLNRSSVSEQPGLSHTANAASALAESVARQGFSPQVDDEVPFAAEIRTPIHRRDIRWIRAADRELVVSDTTRLFDRVPGASTGSCFLPVPILEGSILL